MENYSIPMYIASVINVKTGKVDEVFTAPILFKDDDEATRLYLKAIDESKDLDIYKIAKVAYFDAFEGVVNACEPSVIYIREESDSSDEKEVIESAQ